MTKLKAAAAAGGIASLFALAGASAKTLVMVDETCPQLLNIWTCSKEENGLRFGNLSVAALLARPELFDSHTVVVQGVLANSFEDHFVYLDPNSFEHNLYSNAISLEFPRGQAFEALPPGSTVTVVGRFATGMTANKVLPTVGVISVHELRAEPTRKTAKPSIPTPQTRPAG